MHAPILVAKEVMNEAIVWEDDSLMIEDEIKQSPEIQTLEQQLQKAIDKEEYEIAARIRDKIKDKKLREGVYEAVAQGKVDKSNFEACKEQCNKIITEEKENG